MHRPGASRSSFVTARRWHGRGALFTALVLVAANVASAEAGGAPAAPAPADPGTVTAPLLGTVDVEARRQREALEQQVDAYVVGVVGNALHEGLARWHRRVCPLVAGLPKEQGEFVLARLSEVARAAQVPLAGERCRPNLYVVVAREPGALLKRWRKRDRLLFDFAVGEGAIRRFMESPQPVRVWYSTMASAEDGLPAALESLPLDGPGLGWSQAPVNRIPIGTRIARPVIQNIASVIAVVDAARVEGLTIGQLADYLAMVAFVDVRGEGRVGAAPSILSLFTADPAARPAALSTWDQALMQALYATRQASITQVSAIEALVVNRIAP